MFFEPSGESLNVSCSYSKSPPALKAACGDDGTGRLSSALLPRSTPSELEFPSSTTSSSAT